MSIQKSIVIGIAAALLGASGPAAARLDVPDPIVVEFIVPISIDEAWRLWTTAEGLQSFFSREAVIEPRVMGEFSIIFFPDNPPGSRGAEGLNVLVFEPNERLVVTWSAPPHLPHARAQRAILEISFEEAGANTTIITLTHGNFGRHIDWHLTRAYFEQAWPVVMARFVYASTIGPINWDNPPEGLMFVSPDREQLAAYIAAAN